MHKNHIGQDNSFTSRLIAAKQQRRRESLEVFTFWLGTLLAISLIGLTVYAYHLS